MKTTIMRAPHAMLGNPAQPRPATIVIDATGQITWLRAAVLSDAGLAQAGFDLETAEIIDLPPTEILLPGLIDTHVHCNEPGRTHWEGFATATAAAAKGGITTLIDMPLNSIPPTTTVAALEEKLLAAQDKTAIQVGFWGGIVPETLGTGDIAALWDAGVFGFKCFLADSGVPEFGHLNTAQLYDAMREVAAIDGLLLVHAEDPGVLARHLPQEESSSKYKDFLNSRPAEAEHSAIATVLAAAKETGCRVHILHLSDAGSLPQIAKAKEEGIKVTVETCPHYLTLIAEEIHDGATQCKCCPPIRSAENREQLWLGLQTGVIDTIGSDHSPCCAADKAFGQKDLALISPAKWEEHPNLGLDFGGTGMGNTGNAADFLNAWGGIASVQLAFSLVASGARVRGIPMQQVVQWMSTNPAQLLGLGNYGHISVGARADLISVAADAAYLVRNQDLYQRNKYSAYTDRALSAVVRRVWLEGKEINLAAYQQAEIEPALGAQETEEDFTKTPPLNLKWNTTYLVDRPRRMK